MAYDEPPYQEFETTWVRPEGAPCPDCECCTARLCATAADAAASCSVYSDAPARVKGCPCPARIRAARAAAASHG